MTKSRRTRASLSGGTILLVTDHAGITDLVAAVHGTERATLERPVSLAEDALEVAMQHPPRVAVVDMVSLESVDLLRELTAVCPVVVASNLPPEVALVPCVRVGVQGFVCHPVAPETLDEAILAVSAGGRYVDTSCACWLMERAAAGSLYGSGREWPRLPHEALSPRQAETLQLAQRGVSLEQIAERLDVSVNTVKTHLKRARQKL